MNKFTDFVYNAGKCMGKVGRVVGDFAWPIAIASWGIRLIGYSLREVSSKEKVTVTITTNPASDETNKNEE